MNTRMDLLMFDATYGEGHRRAADAVAAALREVAPAVTVERRDFFEMVSPPVNRATRALYVLFVRHAPALWQLFYRGTERIGPDSAVQRFLNALGRREVERLIRQLTPKVVLNTFPTPAGVVSELRRRGRVAVANAVVVTDHAVHSQWIHPAVDRYYVGSEEVRAGMLARGVDPARVLVSGIPIAPAFAEPVDPAAVRAELGLTRPFVALFMAGAYGLIGGFDAVLRRLAERPLGIGLVVVAGRDEGLRRALAGVACHPSNELVVLGYRTDVHRLMRAASVLVSKAGGLTTSEAMASALPMVIFRPIPGQEEENVRLVTRRGAGVLARTVEELFTTLGALASDPQRLADMAAAARALGRPGAARTVAEDLVSRFW